MICLWENVPGTYEKENNMMVCGLGMGRTWEKFSSLPAKKPQKLETATGKENF